MLRVLGLAMFAGLQAQGGWDPPFREDHRPEMVALFVLGTAIVAVFVIGRRLMRSRAEKSAGQKILE